MSVIGVVDEQGSVKSPASSPPPDKKPKKDNKNSKKEKSPSTKASKHSTGTDEKFAELDNKWSECFSRLEALIMAKSFEKFPGTGFSANKHQPASQTKSHRPTSTTRFTGQGSSAIVHQPTSQTKIN